MGACAPFFLARLHPTAEKDDANRFSAAYQYAWHMAYKMPPFYRLLDYGRRLAWHEHGRVFKICRVSYEGVEDFCDYSNHILI